MFYFLPNSVVVVGWLGRVSLLFETCQCFQMNNLVANFGSRHLGFLVPTLFHPDSLCGVMGRGRGPM